MQRMRSNSFTSQAAAGLLAAALVAAPLAAETARAAEPAPQAGSVTASAGTPHQLHVVILDGEGALNNIKERTAREPIVQIQDENHKPVSEAAVVFLIQGNGGSSAGGAFANGLTSFTTTTGADGIAKAPGLAPNGVAGSFTIVGHRHRGRHHRDLADPPGQRRRRRHSSRQAAAAAIGAASAPDRDHRRGSRGGGGGDSSSRHLDGNEPHQHRHRLDHRSAPRPPESPASRCASADTDLR